MTQTRSEIVEAIIPLVNARADMLTRQRAEAALDIALKAAAEIARNACLVPPDGGAPTETESEMCDRAAAAILALTSEGKDNGQ